MRKAEVSVCFVISLVLALPQSRYVVDSIKRSTRSWTPTEKETISFDVFNQNYDEFLELKRYSRELKITKNIDYLKDVESFDVRQKWPHCSSMHEIYDQANCGSCWAMATVSTSNDKYCIAKGSDTKFRYSFIDCISCVPDHCMGGSVSGAITHMMNEGLVSNNCIPYDYFPTCNHYIKSPDFCQKLPFPEAPPCTNVCKNATIDYYEDKRKLKTNFYGEGEELMKYFLMEKGSLVIYIDVFVDFAFYKKGVYHHVHGEQLSGHLMKLMGWGIDNGTKYWTVANSFNPTWGEDGFMRIQRGTNECNIESVFFSPVPIIYPDD